jgi:tRNA threonylcarbamoyl adenosine modification protein YeaZ
MKILAVDTSTKHLSIALTDGDKLLAGRNVRPKKDMSMTISFDIERVLQHGNTFLHEIDGFVVGLGPGSFTSLRVGLSMMKAFIMVTEKPVVGVPSLDAIAMNIRSRKPCHVLVLNDARRGLFYAAVYDKKDGGLTRRTEYLLKPLEEVVPYLEGETVVVGDTLSLVKDKLAAASAGGKFSVTFAPERQALPHAVELARLGYQRLLRGEHDKVETLTPLYLHPEDCQVSNKK